MIFKDGERADPANYRPITISSALIRLLHRALAARFKKAINLSANQRGFTDIDGTVANTTLGSITYGVGSSAGKLIIS